ncbi:DUF3383 domain-containing protein [Succinivibrio sp.]|uniref:DUF3383 domain-containing protein n=1 Tax=Succinivibrio sp. TaxID=2053619 RepID=UPI00386CD1F0
MAITASNLVQVLPRILKATGQDLVFNGVVLDNNSTLKANTAVAFSSASEVGEYFGTGSNECEFASTYFGGFDNSQVKPATLYFYRLNGEAISAWVRGEALNVKTALNAIKAISAGDLTININGTDRTVTGLDFSAVDSYSGVADVINTALNGAAVVSFSSQFNAFTVTSATTGELSSVGVPTGSAASVLGFNAETAVISDGQDANTVTQSMENLTDKFTNFVTFTTLDEPTDEEALELAQWATTNYTAGVLYLYVCWDTSKANFDSNNTEVISEQLQAENVGATCVCFGVTMAAFVMGVTASIAWDQANSTITYAFKHLSGFGADINSTKEANALDKHKVLYMGNFATRNDNFILSYNGAMLGEWDWLDAYINAVWLCNALQVQLMAMIEAANRIPYNENGYAKIRSNCKDIIERAINNGVIDLGVNISNAQKAELTTLLGADYSDEIRNNGYFLQIVDATAVIRQARNTPSINLVYTYAGAVHKLIVPATAVV